jgi:opacity protein-like surface antigen
MERIGLWAATVIALALPSLQAQAEDSNVYVEATLGRIRQSMDVYEYVIKSPEEELADDNTTELAWGLSLGYEFNEHFAAELGYLDAGSAERRVYGPRIGDQSMQSSRVRGLVASLVPAWSFAESVRAYVRLSALYARDEMTNRNGSLAEASYSSTYDDLTWLAGVGVEYALMDRWSMSLEYVRTGVIERNSTTGDNYLSGATMGFKFRF